MSIGSGVKRVEDRSLLTGKGTYIADLHRPGEVEAHVVRSIHAHAEIVDIDTAGAEELPEVHMVLTAADLPDDLDPIPMRLGEDSDLGEEHELGPVLQYPLARDRVRYVGEPVALIVAENRYAAEDAEDLLAIEYDPLPPVPDVQTALDPDTPSLHPSSGDNEICLLEVTKGSVEDELASAPNVLEEDFSIQRHTGIPLETRGLLAEYPDRGRLTVYGVTKVIHFNRRVLSHLLGMDEDRIHMVETDVGGGFGVRGEFYPEDYLIPYAALQLERPVRWVEDRIEHFTSTNHSREQTHRVRAGFDDRGRILALDDEIFVDSGAYLRTHGVLVSQLTQTMLPGPYDLENLRIRTHVVATNKTGTGTYRSPGRFEANFVRERLVNTIARTLDLDPMEVRFRNLIQPEQMPYSLGYESMGETLEYDVGDYPLLLKKARKAVEQPVRDRPDEGLDEDGLLRGSGWGMFVEKTGHGPWEFAKLEVTEDGRVVCKTGLADVGQGMETMLAQVCGDQLGISYERIRIVHGDTDEVKKGGGSYSDRGTVVGGSAAWEAAAKLKDVLLQGASEALNQPVESIRLQNDAVYSDPDGEGQLSFRELVEACNRQNRSLTVEHTFQVSHMTYPYGAQYAEVSVDPETGQVRLDKTYTAYDVGRAVNPTLIEGQIHGGIAQAIGGTMYEELSYDGQGQLVSASFMDYLLPGVMEMPTTMEIDIFEDAPTPLNPLGVKGAGEAGTAAVAPAVTNAILDALDGSSDEFNHLPIKPETVRNLARHSGASGADVP